MWDQALNSSTDDLGPTTGGDLVGRLLHGLGDPLQHENPVQVQHQNPDQDHDSGPSVVQNERNRVSNGGDGVLLTPRTRLPTTLRTIRAVATICSQPRSLRPGLSQVLQNPDR